MPGENNAVDRKIRLSAFLTHLSISVVILLILLAIIFFVWFPHDFILAGGVEGLMILAGVDLVVGPLLTLIIFNPRKRRVLINFDLTCIGLTQLACIVYGLSLIYPQRPILEVLADNGAHIYTAAELKNYEMTVEALHLPDNPPHRIFLDLPPDRLATNQLKLVHELINKKPYTLAEELYVPAASQESEVIEARIAQIESRLKPAHKAFIEGLESHPDCSWMPIFSIHAIGVGCYSPDAGLLHIALR